MGGDAYVGSSVRDILLIISYGSVLSVLLRLCMWAIRVHAGPVTCHVFVPIRVIFMDGLFQRKLTTVSPHLKGS